MHVNEVAQYITAEREAMTLCAAADVLPDIPEQSCARYTRSWNRDNIKNNYCNNIYADYREMLDAEKPDVAFILCETSKKADAVRECAMRGVDVSIEKPMALSLDEALRIKSYVEKYGIFAMVNYPLTWRGYLHTIKRVIASGKLGRLIKLHFRIGNTGPVGRGAKHRGVSEAAENMTDAQKASLWWYNKSQGGGALLDFCCYGCMLSTWYSQGDALEVSCSAYNEATGFADICDNAVAVVGYENSLSVLEGTWTTPSRAIPAGPTVYFENGVVECRSEGGAAVPFAYDIYGNDVDLSEFEAPLPPQFKNIAAMYAHRVRNGGEVHETLRFDTNMRIMALLDAARRSAESGRRERVSE